MLALKELRGLEAAKYAEHNGVRFLIDESLLLRRESEIQGRPMTVDEIDCLIQEEIGHDYDPAEVVEGSPCYDFLLNRYGDQWIYMPLEGNHPQDEEDAVLRLFNALLDRENPISGGDAIEIAAQDPPMLQDTGFPEDANPDLVFHAARRLAEKGVLEAVTAASGKAQTAYGDTYFFLRTEIDLQLSGVLCDRCRKALSSRPSKLHRKCAERLSAALVKAL